MLELFLRESNMKFLTLFVFIISANVWASVLHVEYQYASVFDRWCTKQNRTVISNDERKELFSKFNEFQNEWDTIGPKLVAAVSKILKKDFKQKEMIAAIFLCKKTPSMSMPLLINGNWFAKGKDSIPSHMITALTFHELLHTFLDDNYSLLLSTSLIARYQRQGESNRVLGHLHLMAIQKMVYLSLGMKDRLNEVIDLESSFSNGGYKRAWEIINKDGYLPFIGELK